MQVDSTLFVLSAFLLLISFLQFRYPLEFWKVVEGWRFKEGSEPADWHLALSKFSAFIAMLLSLVGFYHAFK